RLQMRVRQVVGERADADRARRRDFARLLPAVGHRDAEQARQGSLPPRHGWAGSSLPGSRAETWAPCRQPDAEPDRAGAGPLEISRLVRGNHRDEGADYDYLEAPRARP